MKPINRNDYYALAALMVIIEVAYTYTLRLALHLVIWLAEAFMGICDRMVHGAFEFFRRRT